MRSAFRVVSVNNLDHDLLVITWQVKFYFNCCLGMGGSSSCQIFGAVSTALKWIAKHKFACSHLVHILDDFLFFVGETF